MQTTTARSPCRIPPSKSLPKFLPPGSSPSSPTLLMKKGRDISENFVYAANIIQTCRKRKALAIILKLDFRKAFDSVNWRALDLILEAKGFPFLWQERIRELSTSSQSVVLLNGKPGRWIQCRRGLHQGDTLSHYLFILLADTLQRLILRISQHGDICHPLDPSLPCPVLQYVDDTLIILQGDLGQLTYLKAILDTFSSFSGLQINFDKSTFVPINLSEVLAKQMAALLGCQVSSFPKPYLGLPLTPTKIRFSDLAPSLCKQFSRASQFMPCAPSSSQRASLTILTASAAPSSGWGKPLVLARVAKRFGSSFASLNPSAAWASKIFSA